MVQCVHQGSVCSPRFSVFTVFGVFTVEESVFTSVQYVHHGSMCSPWINVLNKVQYVHCVRYGSMCSVNSP